MTITSIAFFLVATHAWQRSRAKASLGGAGEHAATAAPARRLCDQLTFRP